MTAAIVTEKLTKDFGGGRGLFDLDLEVGEGDVFGYLGPNGAGKSTTIRLLMGLIHATTGKALIFGMDSMERSVELKRSIGYMPGELAQFGGLRGKEIIGHFSALRGGLDPARIKNLTERLDLDLGLKYREYSSGNKRKIAIVLAFMHEPRLLILDEPTNGLDPLNQQEFYKLVKEAQSRGATVFLSSHILSEVEHVCQKVGIIRRGQLVKVARLEDLRELQAHTIDVDFAGEAQPQIFERVPGVEKVVSNHHRVTISMHGSMEPLVDVLAGHHIVSVASREPNLEEVFLTFYDEKAAGASEGAK